VNIEAPAVFSRTALDKQKTQTAAIKIMSKAKQAGTFFGGLIHRKNGDKESRRPPITLRPFTLGWKGFHLYEPEEVAEPTDQINMGRRER
jgi:hypothetical protein